MSTELMDIGNIPPSILLSFKADKLDWKTALGELIDNAFDARASRVDIEFVGPKNLVVQDDGAGCCDILQMLTIGRHFGRNDGLGRYGIGLKNAACWLWGALKIVTHHKGNMHEAMVSWGELSKQENWKIPRTNTSPAREDDKPGTRLVFSGIEKKAPPFEQLVEELGYIFSPAIRSGKQIVIRTKKRPFEVAPWQPPVLQNVITDEFTVDGKGVRIYVGMFPEGVRAKKFGFHFTHRHRVIKEGCGLGAKGHSVTRICGIVDLDGKWQLTKNKTDIVDDCEALENAIWQRCGEVIMQSEEQATVLENVELQSAVTNALRACVNNMRKARRPGDTGKTGSKGPTGRGGKHRKARSTQPGEGNIAERISVGRLKMLFAPCDPETSIGKVDISGSVVYLNPDHPRVESHRSNRNDGALVDMCLTLLSHAAIHEEQKSNLPFAREYHGFVDALSGLMAGQHTEPVQV